MLSFQIGYPYTYNDIKNGGSLMDSNFFDVDS